MPPDVVRHVARQIEISVSRWASIKSGLRRKRLLGLLWLLWLLWYVTAVTAKFGFCVIAVPGELML
jgi:hypothetical protein